MTRVSFLKSFICLLVLTASVCGLAQEPQQEYAVGFPGNLEEIQLPGTLLKAKNIESRAQPFVVRVLNSFATNDGFRYEFEFYGLEPGEHNLTDYLERKDGSEVGELPTLMITVVTSLPPGQIEPNQLQHQSSFFRNYYLPILVAGAGVWFAGLWMILFWGRGRYRKLDPNRHRVTVAQRIRPLIEKAVEGELSPSERGELERTMVSFWQKKLRLDNMAPSELMKRLKSDSASKELFEKLENWLHRPDPPENVNVAELMKPYQTMKMDEIE